VILDRISSSLKTHDWRSALIEVLIVVVGIFIGLQVDDWNQARKNRMDEQQFLERLHENLVLAEELSSRVLQRRLDRLPRLLDASEVLFNRANRDELTVEECTAIAWATAFNITATGLPSVDELIGTGRMGIIRDGQLRTALVALRQTRAALDAMISVQSTSSNFQFLPSAFPDLIQLTGYFDNKLREVRSRTNCDLVAMRANQPFLNQFSANADGYDAYIRDGLRPWSLQSDRVHELVDNALGTNHPVAEEE
jgi:hypothetical protein